MVSCSLGKEIDVVEPIKSGQEPSPFAKVKLRSFLMLSCRDLFIFVRNQLRESWPPSQWVARRVKDHVTRRGPFPLSSGHDLRRRGSIGVSVRWNLVASIAKMLRYSIFNFQFSILRIFLKVTPVLKWRTRRGLPQLNLDWSAETRNLRTILFFFNFFFKMVNFWMKTTLNLKLDQFKR